MGITVVMCTYNGAKYILAQLESIAAQSCLPDQIIICDDGSTDNTTRMIENFIRNTKIPVRFIQNTTRLGVTRNFQQAISLSDNRYTALSDQDDVWLPNKLERQLDFLRQNPQYDMVFSDLLLTDEDLEYLGVTLWEKFRFTGHRRKLWRRGKGFQLQMKNGNVVAGSTLLFRTACREKFQHLLSKPYHIWFHDGIIANVAALENKIGLIEQPLVKYRQHKEQFTEPYRKRTYPNLRLQYQELFDDFTQMGFSKTHLRYLANMLRHLTFRETLPPGKLKRILKVFAEWISLGYFRYSRSIGRVALEDILNNKTGYHS